MSSTLNKKLLEEILQFPIDKLFQAYCVASEQGDSELCESISNHLPPAKLHRFEYLYRLYFMKCFMVAMSVLIGTQLVCGYYNELMRVLLKLDKTTSNETTSDLFQQLLDQFLAYEKDIDRIDDAAGGILKNLAIFDVLHAQAQPIHLWSEIVKHRPENLITKLFQFETLTKLS